MHISDWLPTLYTSAGKSLPLKILRISLFRIIFKTKSVYKSLTVKYVVRKLEVILKFQTIK